MIQQIQSATSPAEKSNRSAAGNGTDGVFSALFAATAGKFTGKGSKSGKSTGANEKTVLGDHSNDASKSSELKAAAGMFPFIPGNGDVNASSTVNLQAATALKSESASVDSDRQSYLNCPLSCGIVSLSKGSPPGIQRTLEIEKSSDTGNAVNSVNLYSGAAVNSQKPASRTDDVAILNFNQTNPSNENSGLTAATFLKNQVESVSLTEQNTAALSSGEIAVSQKGGIADQGTVPQVRNTGQTKNLPQPTNFPQSVSSAQAVNSAGTTNQAQTAVSFPVMQTKNPLQILHSAGESVSVSLSPSADAVQENDPQAAIQAQNFMTKPDTANGFNPVQDINSTPSAAAEQTDSPLPVMQTSCLYPANTPNSISESDQMQTAKQTASGHLLKIADTVQIDPKKAAGLQESGSTKASNSAQEATEVQSESPQQTLNQLPISGSLPGQVEEITQTGSPIQAMLNRNVAVSENPAVLAQSTTPVAAESSSDSNLENSSGQTYRPNKPASVALNTESAQTENVIKEPAQSFQSAFSSDSKADSVIPAAEQKTIKKATDSNIQQTDEKAAAITFPATASANTSRTVVAISDASTQIQKPVLQQVADQIVHNYNQNKSEFKMDLYPENLGKVSVKLSVENSILTVSLSADDPKTQSLLMSHAGHIQSMLQNTVSRDVQVVDSRQNLWYQQNQDGSRHQQNQQNQQQQQSDYSVDTGEDTMNSGEDFLTVMQRLRMQVILS